MKSNHPSRQHLHSFVKGPTRQLQSMAAVARDTRQEEKVEMSVKMTSRDGKPYDVEAHLKQDQELEC